jgi:hypothetical protein
VPTPTMVTVNGAFTPVDRAQEVEFYIPVPVRSASDPDVYLPSSIVALVDQTTGTFTAQIPGSNDPAWSPSSFDYRVVVRGYNLSYTFYTQVPYDASPIDFSALLPSLTPSEGSLYALYSHGSHILVLAVGAPVPSDTPSGTVIVRI